MKNPVGILRPFCNVNVPLELITTNALHPSAPSTPATIPANTIPANTNKKILVMWFRLSNSRPHNPFFFGFRFVPQQPCCP